MRSERLRWSGPLPHKIALGALAMGFPLVSLGLLVGQGTTLGYALAATGSGAAGVALPVALLIERRERRAR